MLVILAACCLLWSHARPAAAQDLPPPLAPIQANLAPLLAESNVMVSMRDGTEIAVDIYRPAVPGRYPTLYAAGPYPHNSDNVAPDTAHTGPVAWFVNQGFNYVIASVRGTGLSGGHYEFLSRQEQQDHYELIEWIARQEWSNGRVAGAGAGYYATAQWQMALQSPPALACIAPYNGVLRPYHDWAYPGGLGNAGFIADWYEQEVRAANAFPVNGTGRLVDYDLRLQVLQHPHFDSFWRERSVFENLQAITIPVYMLRDWNPLEPGLNGSFEALSRLRSNTKLLIAHQQGELPLMQDTNFLRNELLPFYDWCLRNPGLTTHIEKASIRYYIRGQNQLRTESSWPPRNLRVTRLYLGPAADNEEQAAGRLGFTASNSNNRFSTYGAGQAQEEVVFISEPLAEDTIINGPLMLELFISSSGRDTALELALKERVSVRHVDPQASIPVLLQAEPIPEREAVYSVHDILVSTGSLKASARTTDAGAGSENRPHYTFAQASPLQPGSVTRLEIAMQTTAHRFSAGSRIVLSIRQARDASLHGRELSDRIHHHSSTPSALLLPLTQPANRLPAFQSPAPDMNSSAAASAAAPDNESRENPGPPFFSLPGLGI